MTITFVASSSGDMLAGSVLAICRPDIGFSTSISLPFGIGRCRRDYSLRTVGIGECSGATNRDTGFATSIAGAFGRGINGRDLGYVQEVFIPTPSLAYGVVTVTGSAHGFQTIPGEVDEALGRDIGFSTSYVNFGRGINGRDRGFSGSNAPLHNPISLLQFPGYLQITGEASFLPIEYIYFSEALTLDSGWALREKIKLTEDLEPRATRHSALGDAMNVDDELLFLNIMSLMTTLTATDSLVQTFNVLLSMADLLQANDQTLLRRDAIMTVAVMVTMRDKLQLGSVMALPDGATFEDLMSQDVLRLIEMMDALDASTSLAQRMSWIMVCPDAAQLTDALTAARAAQMGLIDSMFVGGVFNFAGEAYTVYAMTTVGGAVTEYTNYDYNSMFTIDGASYGILDTGEFRSLDGDDDAGTEIDASVQTGLMNFGTALYKSVPNVYMGYTSNGALMLEVVAITNGVKKSNWYQLKAIDTPAFDGARFNLAIGVHAKYWSFEITNVDGSDFELDFMHVWRLILSRRK